MNIYFVYVYRHPLSFIPFYVGYGKGKRHLFHINEARRRSTGKHNTHKINTIRKILLSGYEPLIQIIDNYLSKDQACELEEFLISTIGRFDENAGPLTNMTNGGDGNRGWTKEQRQRLSDKRKGTIAALNPVTGERLRVAADDSRWESGELVGHNLGKKNVSNKHGALDKYIIAKDTVTGTSFRVKPDDPRWESGELVGFRKGLAPHKNTIEGSKKRRGVPKSKEHNKKVSDSMRQLKWYCNFTSGEVRRFAEGRQPAEFIRVSGPHKKSPM